MKHLEFEVEEKKYCMTGNCISVYQDGVKLFYRFFTTIEEARKVFLKMYDVTQGVYLCM